jgi:hypothetical protein
VYGLSGDACNLKATGASTLEKNMNSRCPPDPSETAEAAYLGHLERDAHQAFQDHLADCAECRRIYEETVIFIDAIRNSCDGSAGN